MCTVCNNTNICWWTMEQCSFKLYHNMTSCTFGQWEYQHRQHWCLYAANIPHSTHLYVPRSHLQNCWGHFTFQFYWISKHSWPSWVSWWVVCNFRILIPPVFHHPFDRQSLSIFNTGFTREKCHVTVNFGSFSDLNFGWTTEKKTRK